jgi:hypothetical protein
MAQGTVLSFSPSMMGSVLDLDSWCVPLPLSRDRDSQRRPGRVGPRTPDPGPRHRVGGVELPGPTLGDRFGERKPELFIRQWDDALAIPRGVVGGTDAVRVRGGPPARFSWRSLTIPGCRG